ncbi:MAG: hypothetical protein ACP5CD_00775 [Thermovirgaceae bacterium]
MKKCVAVFLAATLLMSPVSALAEEAGTPPVVSQENIEAALYGRSMSGGLIERLVRVEKDLFGRDLPGSLTERLKGLENFILEGSPNQPSMVFKLGVCEWSIGHEVYMQKPVNARISELERVLEGAATEDKPLAMRVEHIVSLLFPDQISWVEIALPTNQVFKVSFLDTVAPGMAKKGDELLLKLEENLIIEGHLVAPAGSLIHATVDSVKQPKSFGRPSEITFAFDYLEPLGPEKIPVFLGDASVTKAESDKTVAAAIGTSIVGLATLGPVGLVGGLFVRGDAKEIPAGTPIYLETAQSMKVHAFPVPAGMLPKDEPITAGEQRQQVPDVGAGTDQGNFDDWEELK